MLKKLIAAASASLILSLSYPAAFAQESTAPGGERWKFCRNKTGYSGKNRAPCMAYQKCLGKISEEEARRYCAQYGAAN